MRLQRLMFAVIVACGVSACAKDATGVTAGPPPLAYLRYVNAVADTFNMDFRAVDQVAYSPPFLNTAFRGLGGGNYQGYQAGSRHVRIFLNPNPSSAAVSVDPTVTSTVMVDTTFSFTAGIYYTLLHVGNARTGAAAKEQLWIIQDALPTQSAATVQYRVVNAAPVQTAATGIDVHVGPSCATALLKSTNLLFKTATAYFSQPPGALVTCLTQTGNTTPVGAAAGYTLQVGAPGTTAADPVYGSGQGGSILTAFIFDATPLLSKALAFPTPGIVYYADMSPPRTTAP
jgi:hypothetical protein